MSLIANGANGLSAADVAAVVGNENGNGMFGGNNGDGWLFLLFILLLWGNNGNWNNGGNGGNNAYPAVQQGFDQAAIIGGIQGIQNSIFNNQYDMAMSLQNCCCENRLATANLGAQIAADGCTTRQVFSDAMRDMIYANAQNSQAQINAINAVGANIDNKLCQLEMDAKNDKIADLQRQLTYAQTVADNAAQTAQIIANNEAQTVALERYLAPTPIPAYVVQNPNCCYQQNNCGCGCNGF